VSRLAPLVPCTAKLPFDFSSYDLPNSWGETSARMHPAPERVAGGRKGAGTLNPNERELVRKFAKAVKHLASTPFPPRLKSHEITDLTKRVGQKVFQSYLENQTPSAGRIFWVYGPAKGQIAVLGLEPHPKDSNGAYGRVPLSAMPSPAAPETSAGAATPVPSPQKGTSRKRGNGDRDVSVEKLGRSKREESDGP